MDAISTQMSSAEVAALNDKFFEDVHSKATKVSCLAQGLLVLIRDDSKEARNGADIVAEKLEALSAELTSELDSANRPKVV